jgi:hypothetical protein
MEMRIIHCWGFIKIYSHVLGFVILIFFIHSLLRCCRAV